MFIFLPQTEKYKLTSYTYDIPRLSRGLYFRKPGDIVCACQNPNTHWNFMIKSN